MPTPFFLIPDAQRYSLRNVNVPVCAIEGSDVGGLAPDDLFNADITIDHGRIVSIDCAGSASTTCGPDLDRSMVLPGMIDCHAHLDKGHISPRQPNLTGDFAGAGQANRVDRSARWTSEDLRRRIEFGLMAAWAHGVVAIRTNLDCHGPQADISLRVFDELRAIWSGRVELQANALVPLDTYASDDAVALADKVAGYGGSLGAVARLRGPSHPDSPQNGAALTRLFQLAAEREIDVDLHVDETDNTESRMLREVARVAMREDFPGRIVCSHCCSLALQTDEYIDATLDELLAARIAIVSLPTVNMYLQSRSAGRTPRWRGVTLLHEMKARGLLVAVAGDNCRDPFHAYGDHDMLDTFSHAVRILQLDHPFGAWLDTATRAPSQIMRLDDRYYGAIAVGSCADLIVTRARTYSELLSRNQFDRVVLRAGRAIDTTLPDYRLLDDLM
jgi:cytosine/creatinine deaminase